MGRQEAVSVVDGTMCAAPSVGLAGCRPQPPSGLAADLITLTRNNPLSTTVCQRRE